MDIGTIAIDLFSLNGGGAPDLSFQIPGGQNFFTTANLNIPPYSNSVGTPGNQTYGPNLALDLRNTQVAKTALISTSSAYGNREYCDFIYYGGHGFPGGFFLGLNPGYGNVVASEMNLGVGYNRWFLANSCSIFNSAAPATTWQPAFHGVKALLGFKSVIFDNNMGWDLYNDFWLNWTFRSKNLSNSFFDAQANYGYKHLYPTKGLHPGCLSAQVPAGTTDYCSQLFKLISHDYAAATPNTGNYYSRIIGNPQY